MSNYFVGLTGGIGSGKSTVANLFANLGIAVISADVISREVVAKGSPALQHIQAKFGHSVIDEQGELDRKALRDIVFTDHSAKDWLNNLLHPLIRQQLTAQAEAAFSPYCILEIPLLVENQLQYLVHRVAVVDCEQDQQVKRAETRDNVSREQIKSIMASQCTREERLSAAQDIVDNAADIAHLQQQVATLHEQYLDLCKQGHSKLAGNSA